METKLQEFLDKEINLAQGNISQGSTSHTYIRNLLTNRRNSDANFPWLIEGDFLSGSYARGTKLYPLDDIDVMIVLDGTGLIPMGLNSTHYIRGNSEGENSPIHEHLGNGAPGWLKTNPKIDADISTRLHDKHSKKLKSVIKLLKYWNREKNADRIRSYHLETIAWYVFHNHTSSITSLSDGIRYFFNNARPYLENQLHEATGFGGVIDSYMTLQDRQASLGSFDRARTAVQLSGLLTPIANWKAIFGDKFGN
jgi:hypothetical protein